MKKEGIIIIAVALSFLAVSNIQAIQIVGNNSLTGNLIRSENDDLTGDSISGKATSQQFAMNITVIPYEDKITIIEPENKTYDFAANETYLLNLSVTSNFAVDTWWFSLYDLNHSDTVYENQTFTPNTNFTARKWENKMVVYANNSTGGIVNASVEYYVNLNNTAPVISIKSPVFACENTNLSYFFNVTDLNEKMKSTDIAPRDIFFLSNHTFDPDDYEFSYNVNYTTWAHEIFSVPLNKTHAGGPNAGSYNHIRNILAWDGGEPAELGVNFDLESVILTVIETNSLPNITNPGVQTIYSRGENSTFYHEFAVEDAEDGNMSSGNLTANISFQGSRLFNITPDGIINFTSNTDEASVNNITVCVSDLGLQNPHPNISLCNESGLSSFSCVNFSLTITNDNRPPNITSYWPLNLKFSVKGLENNYLNITVYDPDGTVPDARWYVDDALVEYDTGSLLKELNYAFACGISGEHVIKVVVTDGIVTDEMQWNVSVTSVPCPSPSEGGGGGLGRICIPKWACKDWNVCKSITQKLNKGEISGEEYRDAKEKCSERKLKEEQCGIQERLCFDVNRCFPEFSEKTETQTCHYTSDPGCFDGIKNCHHGSCELLVDCGGPCTSCPSCSDGIQNQGEEGVDCGGPCPWLCKEEKPAPPPTNYRYGLLLLIILLLLYIMNKTFRIIEKKTVHKSFILSVFLVCLLIFCMVFLYFYSFYNVGDFVYKKDAKIIGEVKNTSSTLTHLIQWQDGTYSKEFILSIGKVNELKNEDIEDILDNNNKQDFSLYSWNPQGLALSEKVPIKRVQDLDEFTIKIKPEECYPSFVCGPWSECKVDYSLEKISGKGLTYGTTSRFCRDASECMSDFIYSDRCVLEEEVMLYKTVTPEENYFEVYDLNSNLVARINKIIDKGVEKLNIEIIG
jgi:hypothetical protein